MVSRDAAAFIATSSQSFPFPSSATIRAFKGNFCGIQMTLPIQGNGPASTGQVLFTPAYMQYGDAGLRQAIRQAYLAAGLTHFVVNLSNHSSIYRDWYAAWDETQVNSFLEELNADGLIVVGSCFPDGSTYLNQSVDESLVHAVFWWEDPSPIGKPALDGDNKFWLARQYFPRQEIYWHNPPGQEGPFVNPPDWGAVLVDGKWSFIEDKIWRYLSDNDLCRGLIYQNKAWLSVDGSAEGLREFLARITPGGMYGASMDVVDFEEVAFYALDESGDLAQASRWTAAVRNQVPSTLAGYCNG